MRRWVLSTVLFLLAMVLPVAAFGEEYIIGEGDALRVSVWGVNDLSLSVRVRPDGVITIPALGEVLAAGLAPVELQESLSEKMKRIVKNPVVTVIVEEIHNNKIYVFGGGVKPGVYNLDRRTSLLQLLCLIEEFNNPDLTKAYVMRKGKRVKEHFYGLFIKGEVEGDILLKPDDVIFIPALGDKNVYVVGAVNTPRFVEYREGLTVMEAILEAGGFNRFAKENKTVIFRKNGSRKVAISVKLKDLVNDGDLRQNMELEPGDYIVVKEGMF
jgi:polysaccharide export outer membrane protein